MFHGTQKSQFYFSRGHCCEVTAKNVRKSIYSMFSSTNLRGFLHMSMKSLFQFQILSFKFCTRMTTLTFLPIAFTEVGKAEIKKKK